MINMMTKVIDMDYLERQRLYRQKTNNASTKRYERTKSGKLMRIYRNMQSRVNGVQKGKHHLYAGKDLLGKEDFYKWAEDSPEFHDLYDKWVESDFDRKLAPTVDRIDPSRGYSLDNMQWLTHSENSRRGGMWRPRR
jgi:ribosomal protein L35